MMLLSNHSHNNITGLEPFKIYGLHSDTKGWALRETLRGQGTSSG